MIEWLQQWYLDNCDGDWEHTYGVKIITLDNPGWSVTIDLADTKLNGIDVPYKLVENSANDWIGYSIVDNVFNGAGDPTKLEQMIRLFKEISDSTA